MKKIRFILLIIFLFLCTLSYTSISWALKTFAFLNFDEIIFQLTTPLQATESSILKSYAAGGLFPALILIFFISIIVLTIYHYLKPKTLKLELKLWKKKKTFNIKTNYIKVIYTLILIIVPIIIVISGLQKVDLFTYIERNYLNDSVDFFKENYVDPQKVNITLP